jgi:hypothetical protein
LSGLNVNLPETSITPHTGTAAVSRWQLLRLHLGAHLVALGFYTGLTLLLAFPAILKMGVSTPGNFFIDRNQNLWNMWWVNHALFDLHSNPFISNLLYYPFGVKLYLQTFSPYNLLVGLPVYFGAGRVAAFSFLMLLGFPTSAYGGYLLGRDLLRDKPFREWGALAAGLLWSFNAYHFAILRMEWLNLVAMQWIPLFVLCLFRLEKSRTRRSMLLNGGLAVLVYLLSLLTDYYYSLFLGIFCGLYLSWKAAAWLKDYLARKSEAGQLRDLGLLLGKIAGVFGLSALIFSPILAPTVSEITSKNYQNLGNVVGFSSHSTDLLQLFLPPANQPWWGAGFGLWHTLNITELNNFGGVIGYVALGLGLLALGRFKGLWFWVFNAGIWLVLSLGAVLSINGSNTGILLPGHWLNRLPLLNIIRFTERYIIMAQLSFSILAAFGLVYLLNRVKDHRVGRLPVSGLLGSLFLGLILLESNPGFINPSTPLTVPKFTEAIAASNSASGVAPDKAIFEMPVTNHGTDDTWRMYYQIFHQRPIFGGYLSRTPVDWYRTGAFTLPDWVDPPANNTPDIVDKSSEQMIGLLNSQNIGFIVIYPADYNGNKDRYENALKLVNQALGESSGQPARPFYQDDTAIVYKVPAVEPSHPLLTLGSGWENVEAVDKQKNIYQRWLDDTLLDGELNVVLPPQAAGQPYSLDFKVASPDKVRRLQVFVNDRQAGEVQVKPGTNEFKLANLSLKPGDNKIFFRADPADGFFVPAEHAKTTDSRKLTLAFISIQVVP